ncbi:MAG: aminotransferase class III-fold pyridoxal phosphate-dependent enzyme [Bacteroidota bacterium]|nr:aminotransferase class III-fold pyridoxal phosphate-dependent enzyme [Bacteroidota bacterium]
MKKSDRYFQEALKYIPWGTQTNAKRHFPFFDEAMPKFIERGKGCRIWDMDGKEYIDFRLALGPVILGYCYDEVDDAVRAQMKKGVLFSMASPIELELAKKTCEIAPAVEMVRFMKTGEEANLCNVRIARAYTKRDMILTSGYHGYTDWFALGDSPHNGVPSALRDYAKEIPWGNLERAEELIEQYNERIACVLTIPYDLNEDTSGTYIRHLRTLTRKYGIVLVFDEVWTGFRVALGGAQQLFNVEADLVSYAKAIANGYPLSAYGGKRKYMKQLNHIKLTTTYAGETFSIAAAIATLDIMQREKVHGHLNAMGKRLMNGFDSIVKELGVEGHAAGLPAAAFIKFHSSDRFYDARLEYLWHRELFREGVFVMLRWFLCYSHSQKDIDDALEKARKALRRALEAELKERKTVTPFYW